MLDSSQKLVVYPQLSDGHYYVVLWDLAEKKALANVKDLAPFQHDPFWASDGRDFIIAVAKHFDPASPDNIIYEWVQVSREEKVDQLTDFGSLFADSEISSGSRSPDNHNIAFWLTVQPSARSQFAVLDIENRTVVNYCIPGFMKGSGLEPIWSPDGRYLIISSDIADNETKLILLVTLDHWAAEIGRNIIANGWVAAP